MELDLRRMLRVECLGILLILVIFFFFDFYPKLKEAGQLKESIRLAKTAPETASQWKMQRQEKGLEEELSQRKEDLPLIQQAILEVQDKVIQGKNIPLVTQEIIGIANSSKIELASVKPLPARVKDGYELLPIDIQFQCVYSDLIKFLSKVEDSSILMAIQDLSINKDESIYPKLDIKLAVCALFRSSE